MKVIFRNENGTFEKLLGEGINKKKQDSKVELTFQHPIRQDLTKTLEISGILDANEKASLRFAAGGKVVSLGAQEGDWIKKWQTIATIDRRELEKRMQKDLNNYMQERWDWDQQLDDIEDRTIDERERRTVDKNQWDLENSVLDVEIRDIAIKNTVLTSPIEGVLIESPTNVSGVQLMATDAFEVINPNSLVFKGLVDESDISLIKSDQYTEIILDSYPDEIINAQVDSIAYKSTETSSGTAFIVEFPITSQNSDLSSSYNSLEHYKLGMNGDADIHLFAKKDILTVPLDAVREDDGKSYVDVKVVGNNASNDTNGENKEYREQEIMIGMETEDYVEILSGLSEDSLVLIP